MNATEGWACKKAGFLLESPGSPFSTLAWRTAVGLFVSSLSSAGIRKDEVEAPNIQSSEEQEPSNACSPAEKKAVE